MHKYACCNSLSSCFVSLREKSSQRKLLPDCIKVTETSSPVPSLFIFQIRFCF